MNFDNYDALRRQTANPDYLDLHERLQILDLSEFGVTRVFPALVSESEYIPHNVDLEFVKSDGKTLEFLCLSLDCVRIRVERSSFVWSPQRIIVTQSNSSEEICDAVQHIAKMISLGQFS